MRSDAEERLEGTSHEAVLGKIDVKDEDLNVISRLALGKRRVEIPL